MGDIGNYWRKHKEYKERRKMGMSQRQYDTTLRTIALEKKIAKQAKCTIQCECGRRGNANPWLRFW
jgi:hypothetical protein